ncbi:MAG TPA: hypothetical protein VMK66_15135 [Myxococcales bacterium]|nr:hypothetical protein [Myxococcales bacterium]
MLASASLTEWTFGVTFATIWSTALLALPAMLGVHRLLRGRLVVPFQRGELERQLVLYAALLGALGALATADGLAQVFGAERAIEPATMLAGFIAPVPLAAVSWSAGEIFTGPSRRPIAAFLAAAAVACLSSWTFYGVLFSSGPQGPLTGWTILMQLPPLFLSSILAARTYLSVRGLSLHELPLEALALERL